MEADELKRIQENQRVINEAFCKMRAQRASHFYLSEPIELKAGDVYYFEGEERRVEKDTELHAVMA